MTKREMFVAIAEVAEVKANAEMMAFIEHEIELLDKKKGSSKPTKTQEANVALKEIILEVMAQGEGTVTEIQSRDERIAPPTVSNQKASALIRQLVAEGLVIKTPDKKKSVFSLA